MMLYEVKDVLKEIKPEDINPNVFTAGCVTCDELARYGKEWGFDDFSIQASQKADPLFRTGVYVYENYTFTQLKIINYDGHEDYVSIFIKKNFLLIVDTLDEDNSTINSFLNALKKHPCDKINEEKLILWFIEDLLSDGSTISEELRNDLSAMEEAIVKDEVDNHFNIELLEIKKNITKYHNFYEQILDVIEVLEENENEILNGDNLKYITILSNKIKRLNDDTLLLIDVANHIQSSYATHIDLRTNKTMKILTIVTTICTPLTIIVGWYGMNFTSMPEFTWKYGYLFVIMLSIVVVAIMIFIGKKKKWF